MVWQKYYIAHRLADLATTQGFTLLEQKFSHYEILDEVTAGQSPTGEYLPQSTTTETVIQQWLSADNLTWQKGYPNNTECEGQTDHNPEMIDPLLNDPDVLQ